MGRGTKEGMNEGKLRALLEELQNELATAEADGEETTQALKRLRRDVEKAMEELGEAAQGEFDHAPLGNRLKEAVTRFEATHPRLTGVINNILNVLAGSGV